MLSNEPKLQEIVALYAIVSRMRVLSSPRTVACAEKVMKATVDTYFAPNKTVREVHELTKSGAGIDPLYIFGQWNLGVRRGSAARFAERLGLSERPGVFYLPAEPRLCLGLPRPAQM